MSSIFLVAGLQARSAIEADKQAVRSLFSGSTMVKTAVSKKKEVRAHDNRYMSGGLSMAFAAEHGRLQFLETFYCTSTKHILCHAFDVCLYACR